VLNADIPLCPSCNVPYKPRDSRKRLVKDSEGKQYTFQLRRLKCPLCGHMGIEIPDIIEPEKHYFKLTIQATIEGKIDYCSADDSTIRRWKK